MGPFVDKKPNWIPIDGDFDGEIVRRSRLHCIPWHGIVMRVDEGLVQVQNEGLPLHQTQSVAGDRRERK